MNKDIVYKLFEIFIIVAVVVFTGLGLLKSNDNARKICNKNDLNTKYYCDMINVKMDVRYNSKIKMIERIKK